MNYTSMKRVLASITRDLGLDSINETDVIEWTGQALELIGTRSIYEESLAFIEVENHQCDLPNHMHAIIQVARNNKWCKDSTNAFCPKEIANEVESESNLECNCSESTCGICNTEHVLIDCQGKPIQDYELAYYRPYFDLQWEYNMWTNSGYYQSHFTPIRLSNHSFFDSVVCKENETTKLYSSNSDEYTIINNNKIRLSFKEGGIAVSYLKHRVDEDGYPMIPDNTSVVNAITYYIIFKMMSREFYNGREGSQVKMQHAEQQWQWYCGQASSNDKMIKGIDEHQNFLQQRSYILPRQNKYAGFFGGLNQPESRRWLHNR